MTIYDAYAGGRIDFSPLGEIGDKIGEAIGDYRTKRDIKSAYEQTGGDYNKMTQLLLGMGNQKAAAQVAVIQDKLTGSENKYGLNMMPVWDPQSKSYKMFQPYSGGGGNVVDAPPGTQWAPRMQGYDNGLGTTILGPGGFSPGGGAVGPDGQPTAGPTSNVPRDIAGAEAEKKKGEARNALPQAQMAADRIIKSIDSVTSDPYLPNMTGYRSYLPNVTPEAKRVQSKVNQIGGQSFLATYDALRGAGQITEAEGSKAEAAISRLRELGVDDPGYAEAAKDAKREVVNLLNVARQKAGEQPLPNPFDTSSGGGSSDEGWTDLGNGVRIRQK